MGQLGLVPITRACPKALLTTSNDNAANITRLRIVNLWFAQVAPNWEIAVLCLNFSERLPHTPFTEHHVVTRPSPTAPNV